MPQLSTPDADFDSVSAELQRRIKLLDQEVIVHKRIATSLETLEPEVSNRIYRLAVVDVFVEKAIHS